MDSIPKLNIALLHNSYLERGGEDISFEAEKKLLEQEGHVVSVYTRNNAEINSYSTLQRLNLANQTIWAGDSYEAVRQLIRREQPAICHINNTFPLISPSAYDACREEGVPVIQNLRNYRLICPNGYLYRDHRICEDCIGRRIPWPGFAHACYRGSRIQSGVVVAMLSYHNFRRTWATKVDTYIALTKFSRNKFIQGGLPAKKIVIKPNFVFDHGLGEPDGRYALFIGRLIDGKGIFELLRAWVECVAIPLKIVGDGPLRANLLSILARENLRSVEFCDQLSSEETIAVLKGARFLVYPSSWYENFPRVLLESFSCGRPVIASNVGAASELVENEKTGLLFQSGDPQDMAAKVRWLWDHAADSRQMGDEARNEYLQKYTPERNYQMLMDIYSRTIASYI